MKTIFTFICAMVTSAIITSMLIYMSAGFIGFFVFLLVPLLLLIVVAEDATYKSISISTGALSCLLAYSIMYAPWEYLSPCIVLAIALVIGVNFYFKKALPEISIIAAWLVGCEFASVIMEYVAAHQYFMDNLWHDIATVTFAIMALGCELQTKKRLHNNV